MRGNRGEVVVSAASSLRLHGHISWRVGGRCRIMAVCLLCKVAGCSVLGVYSAVFPASLPRSPAPCGPLCGQRRHALYPPSSSAGRGSLTPHMWAACTTEYSPSTVQEFRV
ncbi:hypothetical protein CgunFtcFv8_012050 [Champsocephalus gunnari]|uniref:Uncharacterized protein n=1 Tax=Champsocephalus gunnari TaxID=52237 RepID=A0AAN8HI10_CHAGU|nr:hypothetical protein CgunFtcFv8_012050 [Champsocephalus gunnari]